MAMNSVRPDASRLDELSSSVSRFFARLGGLISILKLVRFSLILGVTSALIFLLVPQGQEILLATSANLLQLFFLTLAALMCAGSAWYSARIMFRFDFDELLLPEDAGERWTRIYRWAREQGPRWLGATVPFLLAVAFLIATGGAAWLPALILIAATGGFMLFLANRRKLFAGSTVALQEDTPQFARFKQLGRAAKVYVGASFALYASLLVLFSTNIGGDFASSIGSGAVVFLGLALLVPMGGALIYFAQRYHIPVLSFVVVMAVVFSLFNDNHAVRAEAELAVLPGSELRTERDLTSYYKAWSTDLLASSKSKGDEVPAFLVAAEGGGVRAAYWTALVLSRLQDENTEFARHVFAISGISGGSLGGAVFVALAKSRHAGSTEKLESKAADILAEDFLSPTLAAMLFPDLVQRFLPIACLPDRAQALEQSWEKSWAQHVGSDDLFARPFRGMLPGKGFDSPLLFLNSTDVATGRRVIVNALCEDRGEFDHVFHNALNGMDVIGSDLRVSTAAHMSARFTYVSPAGTIHRRDAREDARFASEQPGENPWIRVVDGGYFENSGTVTALELLEFIRQQESGRSGKRRIRPYVILISNEPIPKEPEELSADAGRRALMSEILSPILGLIHVRPARGFQARGMIEESVDHLEAELAAGGAHPIDASLGSPENRGFLHFSLEKTGVALPLGWLLSPEACAEMKRQLDDRHELIEGVRKRLKGK